MRGSGELGDFSPACGARCAVDLREPDAGRVEEGSGMPDIIWVEARRRLRGELLDKDYDTWIAPLRAARWSADTLALEAPSGFARDWLRQHFLPALERAVTEASGAPATVLLLVNRELSIPARAGALPGHRAAYATNGAPSRYTFDNFVVGESNRVAYGAARAVVAQPGARFNPLFLCGGCALRKTPPASGRRCATASPRGCSRT